MLRARALQEKGAAQDRGSRPLRAEQPAENGGAGGRRDFLTPVTASFAAVGVGAFVWPFVPSDGPGGRRARAGEDGVDLSPVAVGQAATVVWRGKPVFARHRTPRSS